MDLHRPVRIALGAFALALVLVAQSPVLAQYVPTPSGAGIAAFATGKAGSSSSAANSRLAPAGTGPRELATGATQGAAKIDEVRANSPPVVRASTLGCLPDLLGIIGQGAALIGLAIGAMLLAITYVCLPPGSRLSLAHLASPARVIAAGLAVPLVLHIALQILLASAL